MNFIDGDTDAFPSDFAQEADDPMPSILGEQPQTAAQEKGNPTRYSGEFKKWESLDPRYRVNKILGEGSYGQVAEAEHIRYIFFGLLYISDFVLYILYYL